MSAPIIEVQQMSRHFGRLQALNDITFSIRSGEVVGFIGPNGAGKSTTINILMGFISSSAGTVRVLGQSTHPAQAWRQHRDIGFATGDMELPPHFTGKQYLQFVAGIHKIPSLARQQQLIERFRPTLGTPFKHLSRGNKQKIALIAAFSHRPKLIILDEPSSGLDPLMQTAFLDLIREEKERGTTIFMSSHILSEVADVADRVMFMKHGKLIKDSSMKQLIHTHQKYVTLQADSWPSALPKGGLQRGRVHPGGALSFYFSGKDSELIRWLATVKTLRDVSITSVDIDDIFYDLYKDEEAV